MEDELKEVEQFVAMPMPSEPESGEGTVGRQFFYYKNMNYIVHPVEGLLLNDESLINRQRKLAFELVKRLGMNLLKGENILHVSLPVGMFSKMSLLERVAIEHSYAPIFLKAAAEATDPRERLKHCVAFGISALHLLIQQEKPFNPILGETVQRTCGDCEIYCEQISHHPPICGFFMVGPNFRVYSSFEYTVFVAPNSSKSKRRPSATIEFADGTRVTLTQPTLFVTGIVFGRRGLAFDDFLTISDPAHDLYAVVKLNADEPGFVRRLLSLRRKRKDYFL